jgi:hypothetical protein
MNLDQATETQESIPSDSHLEELEGLHKGWVSLWPGRPGMN